MRIKDGFVVEKVGSRYLAVAVGERADEFNALIRMNGTSAFIWEKLAEADRTVEELVGLMTAEYEVDAKRAEKDVIAFTDQLRGAGLLNE